MGHKKQRKAKAGVPASFGYEPTQISISDPALAEFLRMSGITGGMNTEADVLGLTAVYRAQAVISTTIAGLPLKVYRDDGGTRSETDHWLERTPAGPMDLPGFNWTEMILLHLLNHAEAYLSHLFNGAGQLVGLWPVHPLAISKVQWDGTDKLFTVAMADGSQELRGSGEMTQVLGPTTDGLRGLSPISLFRKSFQTSQAGETAANRTFTTGSMISDLVSTEEDVTETEAQTISDSLNGKVRGPESAGAMVFVNRALKFSPWTMNNVDAQFVEARGFQIEEVSRIYGVPVHLLSHTEKQTSWGQGVAEQNFGMARYTFMGWTSRLEAALRAILPPDLFAEFDYKGLFSGTPADEINSLIAQVGSGLLTVDEARAILNRPPAPAAPTPLPVPVGGNAA
jgi:HK97 family phage portal protein